MLYLEENASIIRHRQVKIELGKRVLKRASWKEKSGYHARSLVETTMWQIKSHCSDRLTNKREDTRETQSKIKCKIVNLINAA